MVLYPTPGFLLFGAVDEGPCRGLFAAQGRVFGVMGAVLYEFYADGTSTNRGTLDRDANPATFATNGDVGNQLMITSGTTGYILDLTTNVLTSVVADVTFCGYVDGFFVALDATTSTLKISDLSNGLVWDPTQIQQRSAGADPWKSMLVSNRDIWLFGSLTTEVWYNAGTSPFPFALNPSGFMEHGIGAAFSAARVGGIPTWLGQNDQGGGVVLSAVNGYGGPPKPISTEPVAFAIQGYQAIDDAIGLTYQDQGHDFYLANFQGAGATWGYDLKTDQWHERLYWNSTTGAWEAYRPVFHCYAFGKHLVGDRITGTIFQMSITFATEVDGATTGVRRNRRAPHLASETKWIAYPSIVIDLEQGIGLTNGQGSDPQAMLKWSDDGARTWGNELWRTAGKIGAYRTRLEWARCGASRDRVFDLTWSEPVPLRMVGAYIGDPKVGLS